MSRRAVVTAAAEGAPEEASREAATVKVLVSVITRNRFWLHALSTISLLDSIRQAVLLRSSGVDLPVAFELHVVDDASDHNIKRKRRLMQDLVDRGHVHNYTLLQRQAGTVGALRSVVDVVLGRPDIGYWLHSDDDVLMGPETLRRA
eukprot:CAMPEP_0175440710 /NCGR_PEP_ID=MMETSP0095-20121207/57212_1 /TAXON_ID=311494 /ORGANISM="Alexandrium monilatum, Strain CCMP3105" /LENGTH=146 /DNA_ID=CAMNT_0016740595 /DNA_START=30 /DNA_END=467 /DNA_ORIENTATION=+